MNDTRQLQIVTRVQNILMDCFYKPEEVPGGATPADAIIVEGITARCGFHPGRIAQHKQEIIEIIELMPRTFFQGEGGGWSFLNLCMTAEGEQWGEHSDCEALVILGMAAGVCRFVMPREMWNDLPGAMPYVVFEINKGAVQ